MKKLSDDFVRNLLAKAEKALPNVRPIFTAEEHKLIRRTVRAGDTSLTMRGKDFVVRYFTWKKEDWITIRPAKGNGFVPMFSMPLKKLFDPELEI